MRKPSDTSIKSLQTKASTLIKQRVAWLQGYPLAQPTGLSWQIISSSKIQPTQQIKVTGQLISNTTRALNRLSRDYHHVLDSLVGDQKMWKQSVLWVLDWLKDEINRNAEIPCSLFGESERYDAKQFKLAKKISYAEPKLTALVDALSWFSFTDLDRVKDRLNWIKRHASQLTVLAEMMDEHLFVACSLKLRLLEEKTNAKSVKPLIDLLAQKGIDTTPLDITRDHLKAFKKETFTKVSNWQIENDKPDFIEELHLFIETLLQGSSALAKKKLKVFAMIAEPQLVDQWQKWWLEYDDLAEQLKQLEVSYVDKTTQAKGHQRLWKKVHRLDKARPTACRGASVIHLVSYLSKHLEVSSLRSLEQIIHTLHDRGKGNYAYLMTKQLAAVIKDNCLENQVMIRHWLKSLYRHILLHPQLDKLLRLWIEEVNGNPVAHRGCYTPDQELFDGSFIEKTALTDGSMIDTFYRHVAEMHEIYQDRKAYQFTLTGRLIRAGFEVEQDQTHMQSILQATGDHDDLSLSDIKLARELCEQPDTMVGLIIRLAHAFYYSEIKRWHLHASLRLIRQQHPYLWDVWLNEHGLVDRIVFHINTFESLSAEDYKTLEIASEYDMRHERWIAFYPKPLQDALRLLACLSDRPEQAAIKLCHPSIKDSRSLMDELHYLTQQQVDGEMSAKLIKRIASLEKRLNQDIDLSEKTMTKLKQKLIKRCCREAEERLVHACRVKLHTYMQRTLGEDDLPSWAYEDRVVRIVSAFDELKPTFKALGLRLLKQRKQASPIDLREEEANQAWLKRMAAKGYDMQAWLAADLKFTAVLDGQSVSIAIIDDPLYTLNMGGYFKTCLTPGRFNYFSAVANAADINKRVIFAVNSEGQVLGRCLIAMTEQGKIIRYYTYAHFQRDRMDELFWSYLKQLAQAVGTSCASNGEIARLLSDDWYDDGAVSLADSGEFVILEEKSKFRSTLATMNIGEFYESAATGLCPVGLTAETIPLLVDLPEVIARKELVLPLIFEYVDPAEYDLYDVIKMTRLLEYEGEGKIAIEYFGNRLRGWMLEQWRDREYWLDWVVTTAYATERPQDLLRMLKQTQRRGQQLSAEQMITKADALRALKRHKQALELYKKVIKSVTAKAIIKYAKKCQHYCQQELVR